MGKETELKLSLPSACLPLLKAHAVFQAAEKLGEPKTLDNTYFDTVDLKLQRELIAIRTRQQGDVWLQTVKCASASVGGLSQRPEWEKPYQGEFDFSDIDLKPLRKHLQAIQDQLQPVFTTLFTRDTYFLKTESGAEILLMIDQGDILAKGQQAPLCELELELVSGSAQDLLQLAVELAETLPLVPSDISKAERGYRLFRGEMEQPVKLVDVGLQKQQSPIEAFKALALACVAQWQGNVQGVLVSTDPEFVHQLRISHRRLRALLKVFSPLLNKDWVNHWNNAFSENAAVFSDLRDLDVMCDEVLPKILLQSSAHDWSVPGLHQLIAARRDQARVILVEHPALNRQGYLILSFIAELQALECCESKASSSLALFAFERIDKLRKRCKKAYLAALKQQNEASLHTLRIRLKPLRYALEFFMPVMPKKKALQVYEPVVMSVRALGQINDHHVTERVLKGLTVNDSQYQVALAYISGLQSAALEPQKNAALRELGQLF